MDSRLRTSLSVVRRLVGVGFFLVVIFGPLAWSRLKGLDEAAAVDYTVFCLIIFGVAYAWSVGLAIWRRMGSRRTVGAGARDSTFRVSLVTPRVILGAGFILLFFGVPLTSPLWVPLVWPGTEVKSEGDPVTALLFIGGFLALVVVLVVARKAPPPPVPVLSPGPATVAGGGSWSIADPSQLIVVPNGSARIHVTFVPAQDFEATGVKASVKAVEYWVAAQDEQADRRGIRTNGIATVVELPVVLNGPSSYRMGQPVDWNVEFDLDGQAPPSCGDTENLGCQWTLDISIDGPTGAAAQFEQPILVTQPRARVNSGAMEMPEFSRFEMASASTGPIRVDFRVSPAPLDLAAPAVADVTISNSGAAIACKEIRLEIWAQVKVTVEPAFTMQRILWADSRVGSSLPSGESYIRFQIPATNRTWPDVDLPHGWMRGAMRLIVDIPSKRDLCVQRDICLCLDKPRQPATATTR